jgi:hypothetical protein
VWKEYYQRRVDDPMSIVFFFAPAVEVVVAGDEDGTLYLFVLWNRIVHVQSTGMARILIQQYNLRRWHWQ